MRSKHGRFGDVATAHLRTVGPVFSAIAVVLGIVGQAPMGIAQGIADRESTPRGARHAMIVCGLPGDAEHEAVFAAVLERKKMVKPVAPVEADGDADAEEE